MRSWSISFLLFCLILFSCSQSKEVVDQGQNETTAEEVINCDHQARVVMIEDEGCGLLFKMPNGMLIQAEDFAYDVEEDETVNLSFDVIQGQRPSCSAAQLLVSITCIKESAMSSVPSYCKDVIDVFEIPWMKRIANEVDVTLVTKYDYANEKAYVFEGKQKVIMVDCRGNVLCESDAADSQRCMPVISQLSNAYVILVVNETNE